jgi:hypothetical protein
VTGSLFEEGATLRAEMARKNMYLKVGGGVVGGVRGQGLEGGGE